MEIDIPDLDDVTFTAACGYYHNKLTAEGCHLCKGSGIVLTTPGKRLLEFLKDIGVHIPDPEGYRKIKA